MSHPAESYPIEWKGKTYPLSRLTAGIKKAFVLWHEPRALARAKRLFDAAEWLHFREQVAGGSIFWTTYPSTSVAQETGNDEGKVYLARLQFGDSIIETDASGKKIPMSDAELLELIETKQADESSDYAIVMALLWETQNPKAKTASADTPVPEGSTDTSVK